MNLAREANGWIDTEANALDIRDRFVACVNADAELDAHRSFVEKHVYGFGERAFHWLWKLIIDEMPDPFRFLEVGVYKGQIPSLIRLLADRTGRKADIVGVTLLSGFSGVTGRHDDFPDDDYRQHIHNLHDEFGQVYPTIVQGDSTDPVTQAQAADLGPFDVVFVDGCHEYDYVVEDLVFYPTLLEVGGLLVVDDCASYMKQPFGFFQGIEEVSKAVQAIIESNRRWEHLLAVVHDRVWRRIE